MIAVILLAISVNFLLLYYDLGLGAFLSVVLTIVFIGYKQYKKEQMDKEWIIKSIIILSMSFVFIYRDSLIFKMLTLLLLPLFFSTYYVKFSKGFIHKKIDLIILALLGPLRYGHRLFMDLANKIFKGRQEVKYIVLGVIITLPFIMIIVPLLISSDLILENMTVDFLESFEITGKFVFRIVFITFFASYLYGQVELPFVKKSIRMTNFSNEPIKHVSNTGKNTHLSEVELKEKTMTYSGRVIMSLTFLLMVNVIYGIFTFVQVKYLFLHSGKLPDGISYAEYAREGFFQLLMVSILNVLVIILVEFLNKDGLKSQRLLEITTLLMTIVMVGSAFYRMYLYEAEYGYTVLRLLVFMFLIFLAGFMIFFITYIVSYKKILINILVAYMVVFYILSSLFNIDGFVAKSNIDRFESNKEIDIYYLMSLSEDADKTVMEFLARVQDEEIIVYIDEYHDIDDYYELEEYDNRLQNSDGDSEKNEKDDFRGWNIRKTDPYSKILP